ncbi:MAG: sugar kinase [Armatimonadota bacterium]|nr:sugar kinase [Armatimonadota bacterium]
MFDVVTLGESMLRLAAPPGEALESAPHFDVRTAGAEVNVAATLARLGFRTAWITKLVDDPLGRRLAADARRHGVDTSAIVWTTTGRSGVYFLEQGPLPRGVTVYYDRAGSAFSTLEAGEVTWDVVRGARWAHVTGITPALSAACAATAARFIHEARAAGAKVSIDVNYRRKLWTAERARAGLEPLLASADLVIVARDDAREVFGLDGAPRDVARRAREQFKAGAAVVTAGADGACLADASGVYHETAVPAGEIDPIGRGDAFAAGMLWGALDGDLRAGLRYGVALAAMAQTYLGDVAWVSRQDVLAVLAGRGPKPVR